MRNRVQKRLDRSGVRVGGVLSDGFGRNGRRILDGLARGLGHEAILASLSHHATHKLERLGDALRLELSGAERLILCDLLREYDALLGRIQGLDRDIDSRLEPWSERIALLQTLPGIDRPSARALLAETGPDLGVFGCAERLAAWAGVCPGNDRSAGKRRSGRARMGNKVLRAVLVECAHGAARTHGDQFRGCHKALMARCGSKRAIVATAHKLLRVLCVVLRDARPCHDPEALEFVHGQEPLAQRVAHLDERLVHLDERVAHLDQRVVHLDNRMSRLESRVDEEFPPRSAPDPSSATGRAGPPQNVRL